MTLFSDSPRLFESLYFVKVYSRILLYRVDHRKTLKRLVKVYFYAVVRYLAGSQNPVRDSTDKIFRKVHYMFVVGVRFVKLEQSKLGIVSRIESFVTEYPSYLVYLLKTSDYESLQMELERYTHIHIYVEGVMVRDERTRGSSAGYSVENGRLHLDEAELFEIIPDLLDYLGPLDEYVLDLGICDEIDISLPVSEIGVLESVILLGKRQKRLRQ